MDKKFTKSQLEAINSLDGYNLISAGPGTGKTFTLINKFLELIKQEKTSTKRILFIVFTNQAKNEIISRIRMTFGNYNPTNFSIFTFHSFAVNVIEDILERRITILIPSDEKRLKKRLIKDNNLEISSTEDERILKHKFDSLCQNNYLYTFDRLLSETIKLFENKNSLEMIKNRYDYIFVDEFQDLNTNQLKILKCLIKRNFTVVGDQDQTIYGWRGSKSATINKFIRDYKPKVFFLSDTFRLTKETYAFANSLIIKNSDRIANGIYLSTNKSGNFPLVKSFSDYSDEINWIGDKIKELKEKDKSLRWDDFLILPKSTKISKIDIQASFTAKKIPHYVYQTLDLLSRKISRFILSFLDLLSDVNNDNFLTEFALDFFPNFGPKKIENLVKKSKGESLFETIAKNQDDKICKNFFDFYKLAQGILFENYEDFSIFEILIDFIITKLNWFAKYKNNSEDDKSRANDREIIESFKYIFSIISLDKPREIFLNEFEFIKSALVDIRLESPNNNDEEKNNVRVMTLHSAKGLEAKYVFIPFFNDRFFPWGRTLQSNHNISLIDKEERNLIYVGVTRAKNDIYLTYSNYSFLVKTNHTKYLLDFDKKTYEKSLFSDDKLQENKKYSFKNFFKDNSSLMIGDKIQHNIYGVGEIINIEEGEKSIIKVIFRNSKISRKLIRDHVTIQKLS